MSVTVGSVRSSTVTVLVATVWFPALSRAVTVTVTGPSSLVSSVPPSGVEPTHESRPELPSSAQEKSTTTSAPCATCEPSTGLRRSTVGGVVSGGTQARVPVRVMR